MSDYLVENYSILDRVKSEVNFNPVQETACLRKGMSTLGMRSCEEFPISIHYFVNRYQIRPEKVVAVAFYGFSY